MKSVIMPFEMALLRFLEGIIMRYYAVLISKRRNTPFHLAFLCLFRVTTHF